MELIEKIANIAQDSNLSVNDKVAQIVEIHQNLSPYSDEAFRVSMPAYETVRKLLLNDNYEGCHTSDLIMCNSLLAEAYARNRKPWLIAPLAQHTCDMLTGAIVEDEETINMIVAAIDRMCDSLYNHPRLSMKLYNLQYGFEKGRPTPVEDTLKEAAENIISLATLTQCDTWYAPMKEEFTALLGAEAIREIENNPYTGHLKVDKVEYTEEFENVIDAVEEEVDRRMGQTEYGMGMCFEIWSTKKAILAEKYNIEWRTPSQMNPRVMFD
jgi:hypothetical protein